MDSLFRFPIAELPFVILVLAISFTLHEFAHAYSAYKFGDRTAYEQGRVTLNPMVHLDLFGTILLLIAGFGWAKPVPVNRSKFKNPRLMSVVVSAVGPLSNLLLAFIGVFIAVMFASFGWLNGMSVGGADAITVFLNYLVQINLILFLFNLIPIPPLDGYRILQDVLPLRLSYGLQKYEQWASVIFLLFVFIPPLRRVTLDPLFSLSTDIINIFLIPIRMIFG
ncbi:Peptidase family M50 [compost metagenome]